MDTVTVKTLLDVGKQFISRAFEQSPNSQSVYGYLVALLFALVVFSAWKEHRERKEAREYRDAQEKRWHQQRIADEKRWEKAEQIKEQRRESLTAKLDERFDKLEEYTDRCIDEFEAELKISTKEARTAIENHDKRIARLEWESSKTPPKTGG